MPRPSGRGIALLTSAANYPLHVPCWETMVYYGKHRRFDTDF